MFSSTIFKCTNQFKLNFKTWRKIINCKELHVKIVKAPTWSFLCKLWSYLGVMSKGHLVVVFLTIFSFPLVNFQRFILQFRLLPVACPLPSVLSIFIACSNCGPGKYFTYLAMILKSNYQWIKYSTRYEIHTIHVLQL